MGEVNKEAWLPVRLSVRSYGIDMAAAIFGQ